jgi:arylsulfatase A
MTGKYSFRNYTHFGYLNPQEKTFGHLMQAAGYKTAIAGKWQLNGLYHKAEGHDDNTRPFKAGFDEYCLWQVTTGKSGKKGGERFWSPPLEMNGKFLTKEHNRNLYGPDIMSDFVCDFMERNRDHPFFIYYPTVLVHNPFVPTPDTIGKAPRTHASNKQPKAATARKANFVAMVNYLDKIVGKIVNKVDELGQLDNTIILFTADNGTNIRINSRWNGRNIQGGKGSTTDMGTHVPFVAYWKGHTPKGAVLDNLIDFTDFYSTCADAAGVKPSAQDPIDGRSFLPQLMGKTGRPRDWVMCHYQPYWGKFEGSQYVRDQCYKLYRDERFFNIPDDLTETNSLDPGKSGKQGELARMKLAKVLKTLPPAPPVKGGNKAKERPVHPQWKNIVDPND